MAKSPLASATRSCSLSTGAARAPKSSRSCLRLPCRLRCSHLHHRTKQSLQQTPELRNMAF